jgi:hypothetical protein
MRSILGPGGFGYAELGQQGSCTNFKRLGVFGGLAGQHFLEQLVLRPIPAKPAHR